jgi:hypothetical protein
MTNKYATLALGKRQDAATWQQGCAALGFNEGVSIRDGSPTAAQLADFFGDNANWIYFGGHFGNSTLMNEDRSTKITFAADKVTVSSGASFAEGSGFNMYNSSRVILWGGCSVCSGDSTIQILRTLFGNHVLLGFAGSTGWQMVDAMLGNGFIKTDFFDRLVGSKAENGDKVAAAWMETAKDGYGGGVNESKFRAVDWEGQEWELSGGKIVKGRSFS